VITLDAVFRSAAHIFAGRLAMRSIGPDTAMAASTVPRASRTGTETLATPGSRSPILCAHPRRRVSRSCVSVISPSASMDRWILISAHATRTLEDAPT